ncbi:MAG: hypothetical protein ACJAWO_002184 [Halieaceae bacterium]|jgi:hypothetical protein
MKNLLIKSLVLSVFMLVGFNSFSQDKIYKKDNEIITGKIVELGEEVIKFTQVETGDIRLSISINLVLKIVLENGKEISFDPEVISFADETLDKIYKKNKEVIICTVFEIGEDEVKYRVEEMGEMVFAMNKDMIERIALRNGEILVIKNKMVNEELYADQKKNIIKYGMFSHLFEAMSFGYERSIKPGMSVEGSLGLIGVGRDMSGVNPEGAYLKAGIKFIRTPDFVVRGMKYSHVMKGGYFRPEIAISGYTRDLDMYDPTIPGGGGYTSERYNIIAAAVLLNFGKQWVMNDIFSIDWSAGVGFGAYNEPNNADYYEGNINYHYGFTVGGDIPVAFTTSFKLGILTK